MIIYTKLHLSNILLYSYKQVNVMIIIITIYNDYYYYITIYNNYYI